MLHVHWQEHIYSQRGPSETLRQNNNSGNYEDVSVEQNFWASCLVGKSMIFFSVLIVGYINQKLKA